MPLQDIRPSWTGSPPPRATFMRTGLPAVLQVEKPSAIRDSQSTRKPFLAAMTLAPVAPARSSSAAMGRRRKRRTELLHRGSLDNCHLCGRFNFLTIRALLATRRKGDAVTMADFTNAIERIVAGLEKRNRLLNPMERRVVAYHELGHTLVALALPGTDTVHKVSIIPRGVGALGYTIQRPTEDRYLMTRAELENKMAVLLGGRAAETLVFGEISTGAADDLARVTDIARAMVLRYGMSDALGSVAYDRDRSPFLQPNLPVPQERSYSEDTAHAVDAAVRTL